MKRFSGDIKRFPQMAGLGQIADMRLPETNKSAYYLDKALVEYGNRRSLSNRRTAVWTKLF